MVNEPVIRFVPPATVYVPTLFAKAPTVTLLFCTHKPPVW